MEKHSVTFFTKAIRATGYYNDLKVDGDTRIMVQLSKTKKMINVDGLGHCA